MSLVEDSPSSERRKSLKEADAANQLRVLGSCPLSKYINIADRLFDRFQFAVDGRRLDEAYVFGLRFANLCLSGLPQHPEWKHNDNSKGRKRLTSQVGDVLGMMDVIKQRMDAEELIKIKERIMNKEREEAQRKEIEQSRKHQLDEERLREQKIRDALEEQRAQFLAEQRSQRQDEIKQKLNIEKKKTRALKKKDIEKSAIAKLQAMQSHMSSKEEHATLSEVKSASTKASMKKSKNMKLKTKEAGKPKVIFQGRKKKSSLKSKDEQAKLSSSRSTESSKTQDGTVGFLSVSTSIMMNDSHHSILKEDVLNRHLTPTSSPKEMKKKLVLASAVKERGNEVDPKNINLKTKTLALTEKKNKRNPSPHQTTRSKYATESIKKYPASKDVDSYENKKNEIKRSSQIISSKSAKTSTKKHTAPTSPMKTKNSTSKSYVMSKLEAAKSTMSTMTPSILMSSRNTSVNKNSSGKTNATHATSQNHVTTAHVGFQHAPRNQNERTVIDKLQRTISAQEDRIEEIEEKQIPLLLQAAKTFLKKNNKKEALKCLAHRKRLERQVDTTKAAVFNMETQMFMLESAIEDRYVKKALDEAATAIAGFQQNMSDSKAVVLDTINMSESLPELDVGDFTDEELMDELQDWLSPEDKRRAQEKIDSEDNDFSLLSIPTFLPTAPATTPLLDRTPNIILSE